MFHGFEMLLQTSVKPKELCAFCFPVKCETYKVSCLTVGSQLLIMLMLKRFSLSWIKALQIITLVFPKLVSTLGYGYITHTANSRNVVHLWKLLEKNPWRELMVCPNPAHWLLLVVVPWSQETRCHIRSEKKLLFGGCRHNSSDLTIKNEPGFDVYLSCQLLEATCLKLYRRSVGRGEATGSKLCL